jgi:hypothetical protein
MFEFMLSIVIFLLAAAGMGIGLLRGRRIQGSCGGLNNIPGIASDCGGACRRPCRKRRQDAAHSGNQSIKGTSHGR